MKTVKILCHGRPCNAFRAANGIWICAGCGAAVKVVPPSA